MLVRLFRVRASFGICVVACALGLACTNSPGPPSKATTAQIDQMNQEIASGSASSDAAANWAELAQAIRTARDPVDRMHWISEFARHAAVLPEPARAQRLVELKQLMLEVR